MAKFCGKIGFETTKKTGVDVYEEEITEVKYFGDVIKNRGRITTGSEINSDVNISNQISIIADPFANTHFHSIRYVEWMGSKWRVTDVEVQYPRLVLSIGGLYNE